MLNQSDSFLLDDENLNLENTFLGFEESNLDFDLDLDD